MTDDEKKEAARKALEDYFNAGNSGFKTQCPSCGAIVTKIGPCECGAVLQEIEVVDLDDKLPGCYCGKCGQRSPDENIRAIGDRAMDSLLHLGESEDERRIRYLLDMRTRGFKLSEADKEELKILRRRVAEAEENK